MTTELLWFDRSFVFSGSADDQKHAPNLVDQGGAQGFREVSHGGAQGICLAALTIAAEGAKADIAKPLSRLGPGVFEIALPFRGDALRIVNAVRIGKDLWVLHAFQKKSKQGIKTPKQEIDLIQSRLKLLKETLG
jgi:phage-related protein